MKYGKNTATDTYMAKIILNDMNFYAHHGHYEDERTVGANYKVYLELTYDSSKVEQSDDISDALNYLDVYQVVRTEMEQSSHMLENVTGRILNSVKQKFPQTEHCLVRVSKLAPPLGGDVRAVSVELSY